MQQIIDFILEVEKLKGVTRKTRPLGLDRYENSAEHSWQLALLAISLERFAESPIDMNRVVRMLLVHDIGEIDTGDTIFFAEGGWEERKAAELNAVKGFLAYCRKIKQQSFLPCGRSLSRLKPQKRFLLMPWIGRCLCCLILRMKDRAGAKTASAMNVWSIASSRRFRPDAQRCGNIWKAGWKRPATKVYSEREVKNSTYLIARYL